MSDFNEELPETSERREAAREKAAQLRAQHKKRESRGRILLRGGIVVVLLAVVAIVAISIINTIRPPSPGPLNMLSDGIQIGEGLVAKHTAALQPGDDPVPNVPAEGSQTIAIDVYVDYAEPAAGVFKKTNNDQVTTWVESGAATIEYHPIALRNSTSQGYSTRAANAAACVANFSPDSFFDFNTALLLDQPAEDSSGLSSDQLIDLVKSSGAVSTGAIADCITGTDFQNWVKEATDRATAGPIPNSEIEGITVIPTVLVNGLMYTGAPDDAQAFAAFFVQVAGSSFNEETATPTPTPAPTEATEVPTPSSTP